MALSKSIPATNVDFVTTGLPLSVVFANRDDGWIYGYLPTKFDSSGGVLNDRSVFWSTSNGGGTWTSPDVAAIHSPGGVIDVAAHGRQAYLAAPRGDQGAVGVWTAPVAGGPWKSVTTPTLNTPAGGSNLQAAFTFAGTRAWFVEGNDRGITGAATRRSNGQWTTWRPPCERVGDSFAIPAATSPTDLVVVCTMGGFAYNLSPSAPPGAVVGSNWLYFSTNGGRSFHAGPELHPGTPGPMFTTVEGVPAEPQPGVIVLSRLTNGNSRSNLIESTDSGRTWRTVYGGDALVAQFPSSRFGVGIAQTSSTTTSLIVSSDTGQHWRLLGLASN